METKNQKEEKSSERLSAVVRFNFLFGGNMDIYKCGTSVNLKLSNYRGIITGVLIRDSRVQYEIGYFEDTTYKNQWFSECEIEFDKLIDKEKIGFK